MTLYEVARLAAQVTPRSSATAATVGRYFGAQERTVNDVGELTALLPDLRAAESFLDLEFFWRGQEDASWGIHSSLHRTIARANDVPVEYVMERDVQVVEARIVETARPWVRPGVGARLPTIDLLSRLQHHGVPTRLIDYSADWRVALFFACALSPSTDGRLILTAARTKPDTAMTDNFGLPWRGPAMPSWGARLMVVDGNRDFVRIRNQRGLFMLGGTPSTTPMRRFADRGNPPLSALEVRQAFSLPLSLMSWGRIERARVGRWGPGQQPKHASTLTIRIPSASKRRMLEELESEAGIRTSWSSIYPDPQGLAEILRLHSEVPNRLTMPLTFEKDQI